MATKTADYLVVGGGLTGSVVAHRLAKAGFSVVVLEAGSDPAGNANTITPLGGFALLGSDLDWAYKSTPQGSTLDRVYTLNAGKALGGGTTLNYSGWLRGDANDYDAWADAVGDQRWSYGGLLPWFRKVETFHDGKASKTHHGFDGPLQVTSVSASDPGRRYPLRQPVKQAWAELGVGFNEDQDSGSVSGLAEFHENTKNGEKQLAHLSYSLALPGIEVLTEATVARVLFDGTTANGIELVDGRRFAANKEVILTAGALRTPQILLLSGVGPSATLNRYGIPVVHDLPHVGQNLHDHFALFMAFRLKNPERGLALGKLEHPAFFKGLPCDWVINELEKPSDVQKAIRKEADSSLFANSLLKFPRPLVENFTIYAPAGIPGIPMDGSYVATSTMLLTPTSRGSVSISSASANDPPLIDCGHFFTEVDRTGLVHAARRTLQAMLATKALDDYVEAETPPSGIPGLENIPALTAYSTDAQILERIKLVGGQHQHAGGTGAMGRVVDAEGKVYGVNGLRIADASILPGPVAGHPQATLYAVAEHLGSMIAASA